MYLFFFQLQKRNNFTHFSPVYTNLVPKYVYGAMLIVKLPCKRSCLQFAQVV